MTILQGVHVVSAAAHLAIAGYLLWRGQMMLRTAAFAVFAASFAWWSACLILAHDPTASYSQVAVAYNLSSFGWASFGSLSIALALAFAGRADVLSRRMIQAALAIPPIFVVIQQWRGALATGYLHQSWGWAYEWSDSASTIFFYAYYGIYTAIALAIIFAQRRKTVRSMRAQATIVVSLGLFALVAATTTDVILPQLGIRAVPSIAPVFMLPWMIGIAVAIVRYRFLELTPETVAVGLLAAMNDGVLLVDEAGTIVSCNPAAVRLISRDNELRGSRLSALLPKDIVADLGSSEQVHPIADRVIALSRSAVPGSAQRPIGSLWLLRDVTDRHRIEQALQRAHDELEVRVAERTRDLAEANRELQRVLQSVSGLHATIEAIHKATAVRDVGVGVARTLVDNLAIPGGCRVVLDGEAFASPGLMAGTAPRRDAIVAGGISRGALELHLTRPLTDSEQHLAARVVQEISQALERFALRDAIAQSDRLASIGVLAAGVAHEINNPLTYMSLGLHEIKRRLHSAADAEPIGPRVDQVLHGCERITKIVRELNAFARDGDDVRTIRVGDAIETAVAMAAHQIKHRAHLVVFDEAKAKVNADHGRLTQVFLNLLINAAHAIPEGNADDHQIVISSRDELDHVVVTVVDTGVGIAPNDLPHIFEPFYTTKTGGGGSGLGLAISHKITRSVGGTITVESEPGLGSTFTVRLPSSEVAMTAQTPGTAALATRWPRGTKASPMQGSPRIRDRPSHPRVLTATKAKILIIDDDEPVAQAIASTLDGHDVTIANSGSQAKRVLESSSDFDVIVCDVMMPDDTGPDLYAWIQSRFGALANRIVFVTGGSFSSDTQRFLEGLRGRVILKPFDPSALARVIEKTLKRSRSL